MILWLDAQVSPRLRPWIRREFDVEVIHVRDLGLREAEDSRIFAAARRAKAAVLTKDEDFVILWLDAQVSPRLRPWIRREFDVEVIHVRDLGARGRRFQDLRRRSPGEGSGTDQR